MRFITSLLVFATLMAPTATLAAPSQHLQRMSTLQYKTTQPPTTPAPAVTQPPTTEAPTTEAPTEPPTTEAPTTEAPTYPPTTEAPTEEPTKAPTTSAPTYIVTEAPTSAPTYIVTEAPTTYAPTTSAPTVYTTTAPPTAQAPTQMTWCHHEWITSSESVAFIKSNLTTWTTNLLNQFGLEGEAADFLTTSVLSTKPTSVGDCPYVYDNNIDAYVRITLPSDIYPSFAALYDQYIIDTPFFVTNANSYTCTANQDLDGECTNAINTTSAPTTSAPTGTTTSAPTIITTLAPSTTTKPPTTKAPTQKPGGAATQPPASNSTKAPTSAPTSSTITITTNVTQPDPNTRCIAGVCVTVNSSASRVAAVPIFASVVALVLAMF